MKRKSYKNMTRIPADNMKKHNSIAINDDTADAFAEPGMCFRGLPFGVGTATWTARA